MKLYLASYRIPTPKDLFKLVGAEPENVRVALIPNAKDYYAELAWNYKINEVTEYLSALGMHVTVVDLRQYSDGSKLHDELAKHNLIWAAGGNTFCLRYEMKRSGFDSIIKQLLEAGIVYGGDSAGALVMGRSLRGIEAADIPEFAPEQIYDGLGIVPYSILPHADNEFYSVALGKFRQLHANNDLLELKDSQAAIFEGGDFRVVEAAR